MSIEILKAESIREETSSFWRKSKTKSGHIQSNQESEWHHRRWSNTIKMLKENYS